MVALGTVSSSLTTGNKICIGTTKVFLTTEAHAEIESLYVAAIVSNVITIQRVGRGYVARKGIREKREVVIKLTSLADRIDSLSFSQRLSIYHEIDTTEKATRAYTLLPKMHPVLRRLMNHRKEIERATRAHGILQRCAENAATVEDVQKGLENAKSEFTFASQLDSYLECEVVMQSIRERQSVITQLKRAADDGEVHNASFYFEVIETAQQYDDHLKETEEYKACMKSYEEALKRGKEGEEKEREEEERERVSHINPPQRRRKRSIADIKGQLTLNITKVAAPMALRECLTPNTLQGNRSGKERRPSVPRAASTALRDNDSFFNQSPEHRPRFHIPSALPDSVKDFELILPLPSPRGSLILTSGGNTSEAVKELYEKVEREKERAKSAIEQYRKVVAKSKLQEAALTTLETQIKELRSENRDTRRLFRDLNQSLFDKLAEYHTYREKTTKMEENYQRRVTHLEKELRETKRELCALKDNPQDESTCMSVMELSLAAANKQLSQDFNRKCEEYLSLSLSSHDVMCERDELKRENENLKKQINGMRKEEEKTSAFSDLKQLVLTHSQGHIKKLEDEKTKLEKKNLALMKELRKRRERESRALSKIQKLQAVPENGGREDLKIPKFGHHKTSSVGRHKTLSNLFPHE